jgi:NAD(P)-dependent dehydrogenase (short-subunit alcohol dehydrogenase family)
VSKFTAADVADQSGKTFLVTGANTGLGFETSRVLAARGGRVLLACRSRDKAEAAMDLIRQETPRADLAFVPLDQGDPESIRAAAALVSAEPRLDVLVNNAGVMMPPLSLTKFGVEQQFGVNHLGTFALTALLLPKLAETASQGQPTRVVVTSSLAHKGKLWDMTNLDGAKGYSSGQFYTQSKLANILFLYELDRRLQAAGSPVIAVGCHPGFAATELMRHSAVLRALNPIFSRIFNTATMGAWPTLHAATGPVRPGAYYGPQAMGEMRGPSGEAKRTAMAQDPKLARELWDMSVRMTGIDPGLPPA